MALQPAYFVQHGQPRRTTSQLVPMVPVDTMFVFDTAVPMCCTLCVSMVYEALFGLRGLRDAVVDIRNQQVAIVGHMDPLEALNRLGCFGATPSPRYRMQRQVTRRGASPAVYGETRYRTTQCPVYTLGASAETHYAGLNTSVAHV
ncbi:hypothetical protein KC19_1G080800 [Ceratodon purpureus]|uniref:HMA domain-containing protein n=1 Tax=Ceratodon purpureus TaxID=3225 RepID=A0A8T0J4P3_CERPU|nr:hypothetical protein KC19_1G080800 [Ceratodon purpureus]